MTGNISGGTVAGSTGTFSGDVDIADKIVHTGDTNTAIRFPSADTITAEIGGSEALRVDSSGRVLIGTTTEGHGDADNLTINDTRAGITLRSANDNTGNIYFSDGTSGTAEYKGYVQYSHTSNYLLFGTNATDRVQIDASGRVNIGNLSQRTVWGGNTALQIEGLTGATAAASIVRNSDDASYPWLGLGKSRGTSDGSSTIVQNNDCLGVISWNAADGNDMTSQGAAIYCDIDGTPGADDTPGRLEFHTCPDGSSTAVERMRLDQGGNLILGGTSAQASDSVTLRQDGEVTASGFYFANNIGSAMNDTGIRRATTNTMVFDTNSTERLRITDTVTTVKNGFVVEHSDWNSIRAVNTNANTYGPYLDMYHNSASPADGDEAGEIRFLANDDAGGTVVYGQMRVLSYDVSNGSEDGQFDLQLRNNDVLEEKLKIASTGNALFSANEVKLYNATDTANTTGSQNIAIGAASLYNNETGNYNIAIGRASLYGNTASYNVGIGHESLKSNTTGTNNVGVGYNSLTNNTTANQNTAVGHNSLRANTTVSYTHLTLPTKA